MNGPAEAIKAQEEYIKRTRSCMDSLGLRHRYATNVVNEVRVQMCVRCEVTASFEDYDLLVKALA